MNLTASKLSKQQLSERNENELKRLANFRGSWDEPLTSQRQEGDPFKLVEADLANTKAFAIDNIVSLFS
jgi:hypothetical protein